MKVYIVVTTKLDSSGNNMLEEVIDKIELFTKAEEAISFYEENVAAKIITKELEV